MYGALRKWFVPRPPQQVADTYIALVAAARNPFFYTELKVPDTLDGRFELIVLHLFLLQHRLVAEKSAENTAFSQHLSEAFFADMDSSLRELGVADTGVSHRIKKMGKAYHGCLQAYAAALADPTALRAALARNVYGTVADGDVVALDRMARYVEKTAAALSGVDTATIRDARHTWTDVAAIGV